jgi:hypothetical protein
MKINPLWTVCIITRILIIIIAIYIGKNKSQNIRLIGSVVLWIMGIGFLIKALTGSNEEVQFDKVFWHDTRLVHGMLYMLAGYYLYVGKSTICGIVLCIDIIFSILYRVLSNQ